MLLRLNVEKRRTGFQPVYGAKPHPVREIDRTRARAHFVLLSGKTLHDAQIFVSRWIQTLWSAPTRRSFLFTPALVVEMNRSNSSTSSEKESGDESPHSKYRHRRLSKYIVSPSVRASATEDFGRCWT